MNLNGFAAATGSTEPAAAVRGFLSGLGVDPGAIPVDVDAQAALYRSLVAGRRMLIVLDNAHDTTDVVPLLPGSPTCTVLVTSRHQLAGLVAAHNARPLVLDVFTEDEARDLLARHLGHARVAAEGAAVAELLQRCAGLPLALSIVAARAALHRHLPLSMLVEELREERSRLSGLSAGDSPDTDVRTVFFWSYRGLTPSAAQAFRLLDELTRACLVVQRSPERFVMHDLLRVYACEQAHALDHEAERHAATHRMLDHYLYTAHTAARLLNPPRDPLTLPPLSPGVAPEELTTYDAALAWFGHEHPVLMAVIDQAASTDFDTYVGLLAWTMETYFQRHGHWHDQVRVQHIVLTAATCRVDRHEEARAHRGLGRAYTQLSRYAEALAHYQRALNLNQELDEPVGLGHTHRGLAWLFQQQDRHEKVLTHAEEALDNYRAAGHRPGQARALNILGWCHSRLGNYRQALSVCQRALAHCDLTDRHAHATTLGIIGVAYRQLGDYPQAFTHLQQALTLVHQLDDRYSEVLVRHHLGDTHHAAGNAHAARSCWQNALDILDQLDQLGQPDARYISSKLRNLDDSS